LCGGRAGLNLRPMLPLRVPLAAATALLAAASLASAGAWPRDEGRTFLSFSNIPAVDGDGDLSSWGGLYAERGLTPRLTLGIDGDRPSGGVNWTAWAFLRWDLAPGAVNRQALSVGIGRRGTDDGSDLVLRPGIAVGRGFDTRWGAGWAEAELQAIHAPEGGWTAWKLDGTLGVRRAEGRLLILQAQASDYPGADPQLRLVPSLVTRVAPGLSVELGVSAELAEPRTLGVKLGTWLEF
jgi:hypothetical protein